MDIWPKRDNFKKALVAYKTTTGITNTEVAERLGLAKSALDQILYQKSRKPSLPVIQRASALFGVSVTQFIDDPGGKLQEPKDNSWFKQDHFKATIKSYQANSGKRLPEIATEIGLTWNGLKNLLYQKQYSPALDTLRRAAAFFKVPLSYFVDEPIADTGDSDTIIIPWYQTRLAAGAGATVEPEETYAMRGLKFNRAWLQNHLNITPVKAVAFNIKGDSMSPRFNSGDLVIVARARWIIFSRTASGCCVWRRRLWSSRSAARVAANTR